MVSARITPRTTSRTARLIPALARGAGAALLAFLVGALWLVALARPASAHTVGGAGPTNYHTTLTGDPAVPGVRLSVVENGNRVRLVATAGFPILVEGYEKEPYLRLDTRGVWENRRSSATYLNASRTGDDPGPADVVDPSAPPDWVRVSAAQGGRVEAFWHDHRVHWMGSADPPAVRAAPDQRHRIQDWSVPLTANGRQAVYTGTLEWIPGPSPLPWAAGTVAVLAGTAALGLLRQARWPLAAVLAGLVAADATHSALVAAANADGRLDAFVWGNAVQIAVWAGALAGAVLVVRRSPTGLYLAVSAGLLIAVLGGLPDLGVFVRSGTPVVGPVLVVRVVTAVTLGAGAGLGLAVWLTLRRQPEMSVSSGAPEVPGVSGVSVP
ncbi:conserved membrane hypothetical protein [Frankia sp. Hr75.2]|uniref:hypothetical protein n=1 Tax=Parafrankia sp. Ea1.12 TaxID=573499 RepID=UPI000DA58C89|nr:hypothetical protein [Parafrankia sp. Ea1.12]CAI7973938.1 conserved membrane hypothetical protein [Frankia sp. Hr75.2]SQD98197.1 conserved membrane hypothetical protein [Parafrankia sp. Ea1.12]